MVNLMKTRNILFIVEGKNDEPRFIEQLLSKCYPFHHLTKLLFIQSKKLSIPTIEDYDQLNYAKIFDEYSVRREPLCPELRAAHSVQRATFIFR